MPSGITFGIDSALSDPAGINATTLVANFAEATVVIDIALWSDFNRPALSIVAKQGTVWANACNGPDWQSVFDNTLLFAKTRVANSAGVLTSRVYACKLGATVSVNPTLWFNDIGINFKA
jgi:hypothetical protein